jgi:hypothetical protein
MDLVFKADDHSYWLGPLRIPSVNQLLDLYSHEPSFYTEEGALRGREVHAFTAKMDLENDYELPVPDDSNIDGYVRAYWTFLQEHRVQWIAIEEPFQYKGIYAGTPDRRGSVDDFYGITDLKTGKFIQRYDLQLAAYDFASPIPQSQGLIVLLKENGTYKLMQRDLAEARLAWEGLIDYHTYTRRRK